MSDVPIRRLIVSDFRRIEGTRELPFDAPVVLIHGSNGAGKTSVLSALELALTGRIRSMERQSDRYRAHLPFFGRPYATVRAEVAEYVRAGGSDAPLTVNGARLEGDPAFNDTAAKFYAERCYLDQTSLGRLLDIYQSREGGEQTALEEFVNELLGLEKLDALRDGLSDAKDFRLVKKLAAGVDEADREAKATANQLKEQSALLTKIRAEVGDARSAARDAIAGLHPGATDGIADEDLLTLIEATLSNDSTVAEFTDIQAVQQELIALGGRISALVERPTAQRIQITRAELEAATAAREEWEATEGSRVRAWEAAAEDVGIDLSGPLGAAVERAKSLVLRQLKNAENIRAQVESVSTRLETDTLELEGLQTRLGNAQEHSSALVESLAALRTVIEDSGTSSCPVCDRDFDESGNGSLLRHVDTKLAELATHGQQLVELRNQRDELAERLSRTKVDRAQLSAQLPPADWQQATVRRHEAIAELASEVGEIETAKSYGSNLANRVREHQQSLENLESASSELRHVSNELLRCAALLGANLPTAIHVLDPLQIEGMWAEILEQANARLSRLADYADQCRHARNEASRLRDTLKRESIAVQGLADIAEHKEQWDDRFAEAKRRQGVAREVREAATQARASIVHRVFTESLNDVWKAVFTRLAPNEGFIPRFGLPSVTKKSFDIELETTHRNGQTGGPPQMMLSAGNLNTAALSLFLALHLAVEPVVPCVVFDDPVQAMDEVHVAQFAALIRLLSKQNHRQVIIAVHERELFDYLTLELSPAYEGDELLTIELGELAANDDDRSVTRYRWEPDLAIGLDAASSRTG